MTEFPAVFVLGWDRGRSGRLPHRRCCEEANIYSAHNVTHLNIRKHYLCCARSSV
jgi:hypothetical protein